MQTPLARAGCAQVKANKQCCKHPTIMSGMRIVKRGPVRVFDGFSEKTGIRNNIEPLHRVIRWRRPIWKKTRRASKRRRVTAFPGPWSAGGPRSPSPSSGRQGGRLAAFRGRPPSLGVGRGSAYRGQPGRVAAREASQDEAFDQANHRGVNRAWQIWETIFEVPSRYSRRLWPYWRRSTRPG